ncbi:MAG: response regulator [Deltaproteobacteria bacterium]|nr:response regulator [Deltaproteobacteria bacterium]
MAGEEPKRPVSVLVVDDEVVICSVLSELLTDFGFDVTTATTGTEGDAKLSDGLFDILITDKNLPGIDGIELSRRAKARDADIEIILITGYPSSESIEEAYRIGVSTYLTKPFDNIQDVRDKVVLAVERRRQRVEEARISSETHAVLHAKKS